MLRTPFGPIWRRRISTAVGVFVPELGASFPYRWLRDSCQCADCVHPSTLQKLRRTSDVPNDLHPVQSQLTPNHLRVTWHTTPQHTSIYPFEWLRRYASPGNTTAFHGDLQESTWDAAQLRDTPHLFIDYPRLHEDPSPTLLEALTQLIRHGLVFVRGVPNDVTDDASCELRRLASTLGRIRDTFYGQVWNVKNIMNSTNIAYTNLDLGLHMDLIYCQHPPKYQILHCLRNRVQGGTSIFVDAFRTAEKLQAQSPSAFTALSRTPVSYHYINDGHHLHYTHPIISLSNTRPNRIEHINYSPPFQAPLPIDTPDDFFDALKAFAKLLDAEDGRFEYLLREGDAVIFDNRRILHARTEFRETGQVLEGETSRWLKGCYLEADDVLDRLRCLSKRAALGS